MAFHLFKKKNYADVIYEGGTIYTLDPEYPKASAIAVKEGRVLLAGEQKEMENLKGPDTVCVDLKGAFVIPGLTETMGTPVRTALKGFCLELGKDLTKEEILQAVEDYFNANTDAEFCLAIEANLQTENKVADGNETEDEEGEKTEDVSLKTLISERFPDKSVILASDNGYSIMLNNYADEMVKARAEELEVHTITPEFVINAVVSNDFSITLKQMFQQAEEYASKGITSVYSSEKYSFLENIYRDSLIEAFQADMLKQRYFGSFHVDRRLNPSAVLYTSERKRTICQELNKMVNFNTIEIRFSSDENNGDYMPEEYLKAMGEAAADKGFHVRYLPEDKQAVLTALDVAGNLSAAYHKLSFVVAHEQTLSDEELGTVYTGDAHQLIYGDLVCDKDKTNGEEFLREMTEEKALQLGLIGILGTLEEGKMADMAVFEQDPTELLSQKASMTIIAGKVVYEKDKDNAENWASALSSVIESNTEEIFGEEENE